MPSDESNREARIAIIEAIEARCQNPFGSIGNRKYLHLRAVRWYALPQSPELKDLMSRTSDSNLIELVERAATQSSASLRFELSQTKPPQPQIFEVIEEGKSNNNVEGKLKDSLEAPGSTQSVYYTIHTGQLPLEVVSDLNEFVAEVLKPQSKPLDRIFRRGFMIARLHWPTLIGVLLVIVGLINAVSGLLPNLAPSHLLYSGVALITVGEIFRRFEPRWE